MINKKIKKMDVPIYITSDSKEFRSEDSANTHESELWFDNLKSITIGTSEINYGGSSHSLDYLDSLENYKIEGIKGEGKVFILKDETELKMLELYCDYFEDKAILHDCDYDFPCIVVLDESTKLKTLDSIIQTQLHLIDKLKNIQKDLV